MSLNTGNILQTEYLSGYFKRNKKIFLITLSIFLLFSSVGSLVYDLDDLLEETEIDNSINSIKNEDNLLNDESYDKIYYDENSQDYNEVYEDTINKLFENYSLEGFVDLFLYNFVIDFSCIIGGVLLSIPSLKIAFINAAQIGSIFVNVDFIIILLGIMPHGIFEIPSSIFALAGAFMLTSFELKIAKGILSSKNTVKEQFTNNNYLIKDAIISIGIIFVLLFIAAFIETFITPVLLLLTI